MSRPPPPLNPRKYPCERAVDKSSRLDRLIAQKRAEIATHRPARRHFQEDKG